MEQRGKHTSTTIDLVLETVFSARPVQSVYKEDNWGDQVSWEEFCTGGCEEKS
jgi:hypothetical protein